MSIQGYEEEKWFKEVPKSLGVVSDSDEHVMCDPALDVTDDVVPVAC